MGGIIDNTKVSNDSQKDGYQPSRDDGFFAETHAKFFQRTIRIIHKGRFQYINEPKENNIDKNSNGYFIMAYPAFFKHYIVI